MKLENSLRHNIFRPTGAHGWRTGGYQLAKAAAASVLYGIFTTPSGFIFTYSLVQLPVYLPISSTGIQQVKFGILPDTGY
jgi:hypothetical protein